MKPKSTSFRRAVSYSIFLGATVSLADQARAADGNWNVDADGTWSSVSNWSSDPVVPGTTLGDVVGLNFDITTAGRTVTINTAVRLGTLNIGDAYGSNSYTLALSSGSLTFDNGASAAQLNQLPNSKGDTISAGFSLEGNLAVSNASANNLNLSGIIANGINGAKSITVNSSSSGHVQLNAANTYSGGTTLSAGILRIGNNSAFGSGILTINGGTLAPSGATARTLTNDIVMGGTAIFGDSVGSANLTLSGIVGGAGGITKSGPGTLTLSGVNTFGGGLTIKDGQVTATTSASALGGGGSGAVLLGDTSGSANSTLKSISVANPVTVQSGGSGTLTILGVGGLGTTSFSGGITLNKDATMDSSGGTLTISTVGITGASKITVINSSLTPVLRDHRFNLNVASPSFTGNFDINTNGTLRVGNTAGLSVSNTVKVNSGALLELNVSPVSIAGLNDNAGTGGTVSVIGGSRTLTVGGSGNYSFNGVLDNYLQDVSGTPTLRVLSLTKSGAGTQALGGNNTYSGTTTVSGGVLKLDSANALPGGISAAGGTSALLFSGSGGGVVGLTGDFSRSIVGLTPGVAEVGWTNGGSGGFAAFGGDRTVNFGGLATPITWGNAGGILGANFILSAATADGKVTVVNPISFNSGSRTVTVHNGSAAVDAVLSGVLSSGGTLVKDGLGTLELTAANTYGAATNVLAGTLLVSGAHSGTGTVTVSSGAAVSLGVGGHLRFAPSLTGVCNKITGAGTATLNGTLNLNLSGADLTIGNSWTLVDTTIRNYSLVGITTTSPALTWTLTSGVWSAVDGAKTWKFTQSTGALTLVATASNTFDSWAISNSISGAVFTDDADNDGIDNGTEYAIGGIPTAFTAPAALTPAGANYTLSFTKGTEASADPQIGYAFETSADLAGWTQVAPTTEDSNSVSYTLLKDSLKKFVRLKIIRTTP